MARRGRGSGRGAGLETNRPDRAFGGADAGEGPAAALRDAPE
jgi:hypothetical protein